MGTAELGGTGPPGSVRRNRFFIWKWEAERAVEFAPAERLRGENDGLRYYYRLASELDSVFAGEGVNFLFTWHLDRFDERFRGAVVILLGDEKYQTPRYVSEVRAVFKTGGVRRNSLGSILRLPPSLMWREALREVRNAIVTRQRGVRAGESGSAPVFGVPLGYLLLDDVPFVPFEERSVDLFFAGSVETQRGITLRPRLVSRRQMLAAVEVANRRLPGLRTDISLSGPFANPDQMLDAGSYSARLMNARIALCPRGNFDETFRLGEAARSGCVAIVERVPQRWYYRDLPAVQISRWSTLPQVLERLLADPSGLAERSRQMMSWWAENPAEPAVARYVAASLGHLSSVPNPVSGVLTRG